MAKYHVMEMTKSWQDGWQEWLAGWLVGWLVGSANQRWLVR